MGKIYVNIDDVWQHAPGTKFAVDGSVYLYNGRDDHDGMIEMYQYATNITRYGGEFESDTVFELLDAVPNTNALVILQVQDILRLIDDGWVLSDGSKLCDLKQYYDKLGLLLKLDKAMKDVNGGQFGI